MEDRIASSKEYRAGRGLLSLAQEAKVQSKLLQDEQGLVDGEARLAAFIQSRGRPTDVACQIRSRVVQSRWRRTEVA